MVPPWSASSPGQPDLSVSDLLEVALMRLPEETWRKLGDGQAPVSLPEPGEDAPPVTGDPVVDQWERELWAKVEDL